MSFGNKRIRYLRKSEQKYVYVENSADLHKKLNLLPENEKILILFIQFVLQFFLQM